MGSLHIGPRLGVALVTFAVVATELGLRATGSAGHELRSNPSTRYGYTLVPGQGLNSPRGVSVSINSAGFRDREWTDEDRSSVCIAVLGDSVSFGRDVAPEEVWCRRLETSLRAREDASSGRRIVVQNFSVPGYVLEQYERVFDDSAAPARPAVVVIALAPYSVWPMQVRPDAAFIPLRRWILRTAIFESIDRARREFDMSRDDRRGGGVVIVRRDAHGPIGADPHAPEHDALWETAFERLERIRAQVRSWGGRVVLVSVPLLESSFERPPPSRFEAWARRHADVVWIDPEPALTAEMQPLLDEIQERGLGRSDVWARRKFDPSETPLASLDSSVFLVDDPFHMSTRGHRVVAGVVESAFAEAGLP